MYICKTNYNHPKRDLSSVLKCITYISLLIASCCTNVSYAVDLKSSLESTYNTNEDISKSQTNFLNQIERFSSALSEFLPHVVGHATMRDQKFFDESGTKLGELKDQISTDISIEQNLFRGGSSIANLKAAKSIFRSAKSSLYQEEQDIMLKSIEAYLGYLESKKIYDISNSAVAFRQKQFDLMQAKFKLGEANKTALAFSEGGLFEAKSLRSKYFAILEQAKAKFQQLIGLKPDSVEALPVPAIAEDFTTFNDKVLANNFALTSAKHMLEASKLVIYSSAAALLPQVDAYCTWENNNKTSRSNDPSQNFTTGVRLTVPIFERGGARYSEIRKARNQSRISALQLDQVIKSLQTDIISKWESYVSLKESLNSARSMVSAYTLAVEGVTKEFSLGIKSILDVLEIEQKLVDSQIQQAKIESNYFLQMYALKSSMGELTAQKLELKVKLFQPDREFNKMKIKIIGI